MKKAAAARALDFVEPGMRLGLGSGSTAAHFVDLVGARVRQGLDVVCVPTSQTTARQAQALGIALTTLDETPQLDLTVDGADEIDPNMALIKGGGGALLREKIVACASRRMIVIADAGKQVDVLGRYPLPVEVVSFGVRVTILAIAARASTLGLSGDIIQRKTKDGAALITDNGHPIFDCHFTAIPDPAALAAALAGIPGVVEHGLFVDIASTAIVAGPDGIEVLSRTQG